MTGFDSLQSLLKFMTALTAAGLFAIISSLNIHQ
jgi:hypothetical protein